MFSVYVIVSSPLSPFLFEHMHVLLFLPVVLNRNIKFMRSWNYLHELLMLLLKRTAIARIAFDSWSACKLLTVSLVSQKPNKTEFKNNSVTVVNYLNSLPPILIFLFYFSMNQYFELFGILKLGLICAWNRTPPFPFSCISVEQFLHWGLPQLPSSPATWRWNSSWFNF